MRPTRLAVVFLSLICVSVAAQQPERPGITFRVDVNFVEIDAVVTDAQGNFVRGLTMDDFQILEGGRPQKLASFSLIDLPVAKADPPLHRAAPVEPDVRSNSAPFDGRVFVLVLDDLQTNVRRTPIVRAAARQFVERYLGANDLVAVVTTGGSAQAGQDFTSSRARILGAIERFSGQKILSATQAMSEDASTQRAFRTGRTATDPYILERQNKYRGTLITLKNVAGYLASIRGRRKAMVWIGEGIDFDVAKIFSTSAQQNESAIAAEIRDTIAAATRANVAFYPIDPRGVGAGLDEAVDLPALPDDAQTLQAQGLSGLIAEIRRSQDTLRTIATETGGFAVVNRTDMNDAFRRIVAENSSYYLLGYYPGDDRRDGKFREVEVRVTRPGLQVRARKGYTAPRGNATPARPRVETEASPEVREALNSPLPIAGLPLTFFAAPFAGGPSKGLIVTVVEVGPRGLRFVEKDGAFHEDLELVIVAIDASGKVQDGGRDFVPLKLSPRAHQAISEQGLRLTRRLSVPPGRYQVRVAARESNGAMVGSVTADVTVPEVPDKAIAMSGLVLAVASGSRVVTPTVDDLFKAALPAPPTASREFDRTDTLSAFAEIYDTITAPHKVEIRTTVVADDGTVRVRATEERRNDETGPIVRTIDLQQLPPGRYVLRVEARALLSNTGSVVREVEFKVR